MDVTQIICTAVTAIAAIIVAIIGRQITKSNKEMELRNERRKQESILSIEMMCATMELAVVSANALTGGHNNGNVEEARQRAIKAKKLYYEFERRVLSEELNE